MADNISVRITADVASLKAQFAVARAESGALRSELAQLARQAAQGAGGDALKADLLKASEASLAAEGRVAKLRSELVAASAAPRGFGESMSDLRHTMQGLVDPIRGVYDGVGELAAVFAVAAIADKIGALGISVFKNAENIHRQAEVLGISTDAYQAYANSARDAGVETGVVDTALERFNKAQGEAQFGSHAQAQAFEELGVSAREPAEKTIPAVARALLALGPTAEAARLETLLFGRAGEEIRPVLEQWAQGTDTLVAKTQAAGEIIDQDSIDKAAQATMAWERFANRLETQVTPAIVAVGNAALTAAEHVGATIDKVDRMALLQRREMLQKNPADRKLWKEMGWDPDLVTEWSKTYEPPATPELVSVAGVSDRNEHATTKADLAGEIEGLSELDSKIQERKQLTDELAGAQKALADARALGTPDQVKQATQAVADLRKQLDELNRPERGAGDTGARQAAEQQVRWAREASAELEAMDRSDAERDVSLARLAAEQKRQILADELAAGRITAQQKFDAEMDALGTETQAELAAEQLILDSSTATLAQLEAAENRKAVIVAQTNAAIAASQRELTENLKRENEEQASAWRSVTGEILSSETRLVSDVFSRRQSLGVDLARLGMQMVENELAADLKALTAHEMVNLGILASDKATAQEGLLFKLGAYVADQMGLISSETAKTAAVSAGVSTRTAVQAAGNMSGLALQRATAASTVQIDAAQAAAGAYQSASQVPYIGWILGPIAAAAAYTGVMAFGSFEVGADRIPHDMVANIHRDEMIIPAVPAEALRRRMTAGEAGFDLGAMRGDTYNRAGDNVTHNWTYNSADTFHTRGGVLDELRDNHLEFASLIQELARGGHIRFA